jgi:hypothetical protein
MPTEKNTDQQRDTDEERHTLNRSKSTLDDEFKRRFVWRSCCLELDKRAVLFFSQLFVSLLMLCACVTLLGLNQDCATYSRYSPMLTFIVGVWLPQPQFRE